MLVANSLIAQEFMPINGNQIQYEKKAQASLPLFS